MIEFALSALLQFGAAAVVLFGFRTEDRRVHQVLLAGAFAALGVWFGIAPIQALASRLETGTWSSPSGSPIAELTAVLISAAILAGVVLISRDMAARLRAQQRLREEVNELRVIVDRSIDTIYRVDVEGRIVMASPSIRDLLGYTPEELVGRKLTDLYVEPEDRTVYLRTLEASGGSLTGYEAHLRHKDGHIVVAASSSTYVRDDEGRVIGIAGTARNMTQQRRAEALSARLGRIVEDSMNEIYVFDATTLQFQMVNRGARENLGLSMEQLRSMTPVDLKPEFTREDFNRLIAPLRDGEKNVMTFSTVHKRADGSLYDAEVRLAMSRTEDAPVFFAIIQDVTNHRQTEEALRQAQKMEAVGQLTGGVAHDFNNLLAIIVGSLDLAHEDAAQQGAQSEHIDRARRAAQRGADLTKRLLAFSRRQPLSPCAVDLAVAMTELSDLLRRTLGATIELTIDHDPDLWHCAADPSLLENCIINLAINARDAMDAGGLLTISTANLEVDPKAAALASIEPGHYVRLRVGDNGSGMDPQILQRAFEPFFTTKSADKGSGLGLSMVYGFVKQSGGHIEIHSARGEGTVVEILLPRSTETRPPDESSEQATEAFGNGRKVLVVEDDDEVREVVAAYLDRLGFVTLMTHDGPSGMSALQSDPTICALVTDVILPGPMCGFDIAQHCRQHYPSVHVVLMSGYTHGKDQQSKERGAQFALLQKPFTQRALGEKLFALQASDLKAVAGGR